MPRRKERTPELREKVLQAAMDTLVVGGVGQFTTRRVAEAASTSTPAVYELFGDKAGLVREMFFQAFRELGARFDRLPRTDDPIVDLRAGIDAFRRFVVEHPALSQLMWSRPFADFDPGPDERSAGDRTRQFVLDGARRCVEAGALGGDPTDIAHVVLALSRGMASQEAAGWLGTTPESVQRRWDRAVGALLTGLARDGNA